MTGSKEQLLLNQALKWSSYNVQNNCSVEIWLEWLHLIHTERSLTFRLTAGPIYVVGINLTINTIFLLAVHAEKTLVKNCSCFR